MSYSEKEQIKGYITEMSLKTFQRLKEDINTLILFELMQTVTIIFTVSIGFLILLYTLLDRRKITVWSLWCTTLCGFIQVCYCTANVFAAREDKFVPEQESMQCSDIYTIPMICDILTIIVLITSAIGVHFKSTKAKILKHVFFVYILSSAMFVVAIHSVGKFNSQTGVSLSTNLVLKPTSCKSDPADNVVSIACEYVLIYLPMAVAMLFLYLKANSQSEDKPSLQFFTPCNDDNGCITCLHQNMVCKTVLVAYCICMYVLRPLTILVCYTYDALNSDMTPSLFSTAIYVYLCFEYCSILLNNCKQCIETQTNDKDIEALTSLQDTLVNTKHTKDASMLDIQTEPRTTDTDTSILIPHMPKDSSC